MEIALHHERERASICPERSPRFLYRLFRRILPRARTALAEWTSRAAVIPDPALRTHALSSLARKRFHADGGSVFAAAVDEDQCERLVEVIVALQTISDYLDNLCDRAGITDEDDFRQLHHALRDAVRPDAPHRAYYRLRGSPDDGGYLDALVSACQVRLAGLPRYDTIRPHVAWLIERYCELQEQKHIAPGDRSERLQKWAEPYLRQFPGLQWWEFAAASGSTLAVFALIALITASGSAATAATAAEVTAAYFPSICGLHILLDYTIDVEEDRREGDFNFVLCYSSPREAWHRLRWFAARSLDSARLLSAHSAIHRHIVYGLLGMYLSDRKARRQTVARRARRALWAFGPTAWLYYWACVLYRHVR